VSDITRDEDKLDNQTSFVVADKLSGASSWLYNQGLEKAKIRDLSGAISFLKLSIKYNKKNIEARNLLGLVYFEIGEIVSALEQWVVSRHLNPEDNIAENYINEIQANQTKLDNLNQAITKYNGALAQIKQKSSDLAIIQLKKVLSINPNFIKAYCLLALVYIKEGDYEKAKKQLNKVLTIDKTNALANRYLLDISTEYPSHNGSNKNFLKEVVSLDEKAMRKNARVNSKTSVVSQFINIVIGIVIGAIAVFGLVLPGITIYQKQQTKQWKTKYEDLSKSNDNSNNQDSTKEENLNTQITQLQNDLSVAQSSIQNYEQIDKLLLATEYYMNDQITEAAEQILSISSESINNTNAVDLYNMIKQDSFSKVVTTNYNLGKKAYDNKKYEDALNSLKVAEIYLEGAATSTTGDDGVVTITQDPNYENIIYFLARCYHALDEKALAAKYYEIIVTNYTNYRNYQRAVTYYNQVN
jgi:tetratricopeptide (TPR) repeat protein